MPSHGNLRSAYTLNARKYLLNDSDMTELTKPHLDRLTPKEFAQRMRDKSLFGKILDDTLQSAAIEIDRSTDLSDLAKAVVRIVLSPLLRNKTSPDVDVIEKAFEAIAVFDDEIQNNEAPAEVQPLIEPPVEEHSLLTDMASIGSAVVESIPQLETIKEAVHVVGAFKRTYDSVRSGSSKTKSPKKTPQVTVRMSQLPKVKEYIHDSTLTEFLGETGDVVTPAVSEQRQNLWDTHSAKTCAACKHIVERSWPTMKVSPTGKRQKAIAFFHGALSNGMQDVQFDFDRVKDRADHWFNTSEILTRTLLEEDNILGVSTCWN